MKILFFVFSILVAIANGFDELTNTNCVNARVLASPQSDQGQCGFGPSNSTTGVGDNHYITSINEGLFEQGRACGTCWELTGPGGSITVVITNMCSSQTDICNTGVPQFMVGYDAFSVLSQDKNPNAQLLYDVSARPISCQVNGPLKLKMTGSNVYNINAFAFNMDYGVDSISLLASGWYNSAPLIRNTYTSSFQLQSSNSRILPPIIITANSILGDSLSLTILGSVVDLQIVLFPSNFAGDLASTNGTCAYIPPQGDIYHDNIIGYGWNTQLSINFNANLSSTDSPYEGPTCMELTLGSNGYIDFSRNGGFQLGDYTDFTFAVRASEFPLPLSVYALTPATSEIYTFTADVDWSVIQVGLDTLVPNLDSNTIIWGLLIVNNQSNAVTLYFDNVALIDVNDPSSYPNWNSTNAPAPNPNQTPPPSIPTPNPRSNETVSTTGSGSLLFPHLTLLLFSFLLFIMS